ncbi:hypothetical protein BDA99DRAFT_126014 [Phascolomyces articulosus]|uniref:GATA-type domain-containing protein n=1 Tax=Phascolomyces articulosus TaxID=60185 RepID=A0AAD5PJQ5_9FUNG|nr:hypothetical protein BDA99DRAFT_126014 [Phascolomyces articulosus]
MTVFTKACFWAILDPEQFRFLYLPDSIAQITVGDENRSICDLLQNRSLLDFIHPDEFTSAKTDLEQFLSVRTLAGSITRCRVLSFQYILKYQKLNRSNSLPPHQNNDYNHHHHHHHHHHQILSSYSSPTSNNNNILDPYSDAQYEIVDIALYIATENMILAFFHTKERPTIHNKEDSYYCGDCEPNQCEINSMLDILETQRQQQSSSHDNVYFKPAAASASENLRLFQIHNSMTGKLIVSLPTSFTHHSSTTPPTTINMYNASSPSYHENDGELWIPNNEHASSYYQSQQRQQQKERLDEILCTIKNVMEKEILLLNSMTPRHAKLQYQKLPCTHPFRSSTMVYLSDGMYRFEHIIIPYGYITFGAIQVTMVIPLTRITPTIKGREDGSPISEHHTNHNDCNDTPTVRNSTYHHYVHYNAPESQQQENMHGITLDSPVNVNASHSFSERPNLLNNDHQCDITNTAPTSTPLHHHSSSSSKQSGSSPFIGGNLQKLSHHPNSKDYDDYDRHNNSTPSSTMTRTTMHRISNNKNGSQVYMSINQLLCSQTCESSSIHLHHASPNAYPNHHGSPDTTFVNIQGRSSNSNQSMAVRVCTKCYTNKSLEWRKGPTGEKT